MLGPSSSKTTYVFFIVFIALYILSVFINWSVLPLDGEEPRRAVVSIEMLQSGNYISPTVFGWIYLNKPPVYNWIMSFLMFLFGTREEWVVRLPSLIFLLVWAFFYYQFSKKFFPQNIAIVSALFLLTDFDLFFYALGSGGEIDVFYSFVVYMQIMLLFYFNQQQKWLQLFLWSYVFCAVGFLTKGFPSLVFQGFTIIALCVFNRSIKVIFSWQHFVGLFVFCGIVSAYLFALSFYTSPRWLLINLLNESLLKSAVGEKSERLWRKVFIYPFSFLKLLLPWSLLLLFLLKKHSYKLAGHPLVKFSFLFIVFNLWLYAFTGRPILRYVYVFIPFSYHIIAFIFWKTLQEQPAFIEKVFKYAALVFVVVIAVLIALPFFNTPPVSPIFFTLVMAAFLFLYYKTRFNIVWLFCAGIVLVRLIYASLFIPIQ
jgi:4-amino-4-deoxy-L-arabinose transferase-like glycosyltransferase